MVPIFQMLLIFSRILQSVSSEFYNLIEVIQPCGNLTKGILPSMPLCWLDLVTNKQKSMSEIKGLSWLTNL